MTITLQVAQRFDTYSVGDQIPLPDVAAQALLKAFPGRYQFASITTGPSPGTPIVIPTQPLAVVAVVGIPDPSLAATYGYALDLTSVPSTLYHWTGTAWGIVLQAGTGGGSPAIPANTTLPAITGTAQVGQTLTASQGAWSNMPTSYAYQWRRGGAAITGATASTYVPVTGDIGAVLTCAVTASNAGGASSAVSAGTSVVIAALTAPGAIAAAPTASATTSLSVTLAWLAPSTGGAAADYIVQYKLSSDTIWTTIDTGSTALSSTVGGLAAATSYDFQVAASNSAGQGTASPILTVSTAAGSGPDLTNPANTELLHNL